MDLKKFDQKSDKAKIASVKAGKVKDFVPAQFQRAWAKEVLERDGLLVSATVVGQEKELTQILPLPTNVGYQKSNLNVFVETNNLKDAQGMILDSEKWVGKEVKVYTNEGKQGGLFLSILPPRPKEDEREPVKPEDRYRR